MRGLIALVLLIPPAGIQALERSPDPRHERFSVRSGFQDGIDWEFEVVPECVTGVSLVAVGQVIAATDSEIRFRVETVLVGQAGPTLRIGGDGLRWVTVRGAADRIPVAGERFEVYLDRRASALVTRCAKKRDEPGPLSTQEVALISCWSNPTVARLEGLLASSDADEVLAGASCLNNILVGDGSQEAIAALGQVLIEAAVMAETRPELWDYLWRPIREVLDAVQFNVTNNEMPPPSWFRGVDERLDSIYPCWNGSDVDKVGKLIATDNVLDHKKALQCMSGSMASNLPQPERTRLGKLLIVAAPRLRSHPEVAMQMADQLEGLDQLVSGAARRKGEAPPEWTTRAKTSVRALRGEAPDSDE